jgi:hypothetical protein
MKLCNFDLIWRRRGISMCNFEEVLFFFFIIFFPKDPKHGQIFSGHGDGRPLLSSPALIQPPVSVENPSLAS